MSGSLTEWDGARVRRWLDSRISAARADQVEAERHGRERQDDCDMAAAEEMVCSAMSRGGAADLQSAFARELQTMLERDEYVWRGVYNDARFDRHARTFLRKLIRMTKANAGFENTLRHQ